MAGVRSPNYPNHSLAGALELARKIYAADGRNKVSRATVADLLGHDSLSGPALGKIGALRAYGLLVGTGEELKISDDAIAAMMAPEVSAERKEAMERLAENPTIFAEIHKTFSSLPSKQNLHYWLIQRGFSVASAAIAANCYLETRTLVDSLEGEYAGRKQEEVQPTTTEPPTKPANFFANLVESPKMPPSAERELTTGLLSKTSGFRLLVTGRIGAKEIDRLIAKLELDKEILAGTDYVDGSWHFVEFTSDMAAQEVVRFASALKSKHHVSGDVAGCEAYRKEEPDGVQLVLLNPLASRLVNEMPRYNHLLQSVSPPEDLSVFRELGAFS